MAATGQNRRKILVVDKELQKRLILTVTTIPTLVLTLVSVAMAVICRRLLAEAARAEVELPSLVPLFVSVLVFILVAGAVILLQALRFSHRIAGPIYRITKSMQRVRSGDIAFRVHLRKGDHLTEIAEELNFLLDWLNANPPAGAKTGGDVVQLEDDSEHALADVLESEEEELAAFTMEQARD